MEKKKLLISACLLGIPCRYDGKAKQPIAELDRLSELYELIPVCPEIYGGLPTPRTPSERVGDKVIMKDGTDVTENYNRGANATVSIAKALGATHALLKQRSPSCGTKEIYDGTFSSVTVKGMGTAAQKLSESDIRLFSENEIDELLK
jgi:uncharacterized protein YbbK (DUF523 family)